MTYPDLHDVTSEACRIRDRPSKLFCLISPKRNTTTTAFIGGLKIFERTLHIPESILRAWLYAYRSKIAQLAKQAMGEFPCGGRAASVCLCLREWYTETWRTTYIRTEKDARPGWRTSEDETIGQWVLLDLRRSTRSTSVVRGGFASDHVTLPPTRNL